MSSLNSLLSKINASIRSFCEKLRNKFACPENSNREESLLNTTFELQDIKDSRNYSFKSRYNPDRPSISLEDFDVLKLLGSGSYGRVLQVRNKKDKMLYAIKVLSKENLKKSNNLKRFKMEVEILKRVSYPLLIELKQIFDTEDNYYLVTEYLPGGSLMNHLKNEVYFLEEKAKFYLCELIIVLEYLHGVNIIYRDLKPENILISRTGHIKLVDFGLSKIEIRDRTYSFCGTTNYIAPEVFKGKGYNREVDWWSLGAVYYELLLGKPPFSEITEKSKKIDFSSKTLVKPKKISIECFDFIKELLHSDPSKRLSGDTIRRHVYLKDIDWNRFKNLKVDPPFIPKLKTDDDVKYFDKNITKISNHNLLNREFKRMSGFDANKSKCPRKSKKTFSHKDLFTNLRPPIFERTLNK